MNQKMRKRHKSKRNVRYVRIKATPPAMVTYESAISGTTISGYRVVFTHRSCRPQPTCNADRCARKFIHLSDFLGAARAMSSAVIDLVRTGRPIFTSLIGPILRLIAVY